MNRQYTEYAIHSEHCAVIMGPVRMHGSDVILGQAIQTGGASIERPD